MTGKLEGRRAIITGGASGIGAASVRRFCAEGARVLIVDVDEPKGRALIDGLPERQAEFFAADLADADQCRSVVEEAYRVLGGVDILFNNAGIGNFCETPELPIEEWRRVMAINLDAVFLLCKHTIPVMRDAGGGVIVNTASASGLAADYGFTVYNASKAALINFTRCLAIDHARDNIRANSICPGPVETPLFLDGISEFAGLAELWKSKVPLGRFARPEEIAAAALFLASEDASYITGADLIVDGGLLAQTGQPDLRPPKM